MVKWKNPKNGGCLYYDKNGYRYYIMDAWQSSWWHIERRKIIEQNRKKYKSFWELHFAMFGEKPIMNGTDKELCAMYEIRFRTSWANCGNDNIRKWESDGKHYAVDLNEKSFWRYELTEKVSPDFQTVEECKSYADEELFKDTALF